MLKTILAAATLAVVAAAPAQARDSFDVHCADVVILQSKQVQSELKITEAQRGQMNQHAAWHRGQLEAYDKELGGKKAPDQARLLGLMNGLKTRVMTVLTPGQLKRLRELSLQRVGMTALCDPIVAKRVGMSDAQLKKMQGIFAANGRAYTKIEQEAAQAVLKPYANRQVKDKAEADKLNKEVQAKLKAAGQRVKPRLDAIQKGAEKQMRAVLTSSQYNTYQGLRGKPFRAA